MLTGLIVLAVGAAVVLVLALVALAVTGAVVGMIVAAAAFFLKLVAPILLVGWAVTRFLQPRERRVERQERRWLEGR